MLSHHQRTGYDAPVIFPIHLGAFLKMLRDRHGLSQAEIVRHLTGWSQSAYSKVEKNIHAPSFDQLASIYQALASAGVHLTLHDRQQFLLLARRKIESMKTRHERQPDAAWDTLRETLAHIDQLPVDIPSAKPSRVPHPKPGFVESRHLLGREPWLASLLAHLRGPVPTKALILQGPPGIGKTPELHRLAARFLHADPSTTIVLCSLPSLEQETLDAASALERVLSDLLEAIGSPYASLPATSLQARIRYVLDQLAQEERPVLILLDNAEHFLTEQGQVAPVWHQFLATFLRTTHRALFLIATKEWPTSFVEETQLVHSTMVPPLSRTEGSELLRRLGLQDSPEERLAQVVDTVGGIPLCLHWVARLVQEPLLHSDWADFEEAAGSDAQLRRLLEDASLFGGPVAHKLHLLLERVTKRLSAEAVMALRDLAAAPVPLGGAALQALYRDPGPIKELRDASLLVAYPKRVQLLPMVAATVRAQLSDEQRAQAEERVIVALTTWLESGIAGLREQGIVFSGLATLLLRRHRLLAAADLILYHGWLAAHIGQIFHLAQLVRQVLDARPWPDSPETEAETECGRMLLHYYLDSYLGVSIDEQERAEAYQHLQDLVADGQVSVDPLMEVHLVDQIMLALFNRNQFDEAHHLLDACLQQLEPLLPTDAELHATLLSKQAILYNRQSGFLQFHGQEEQARQLRERVIALYQHCLSLLEEAQCHVKADTLRESTLKKKRASFLNNLAYQLNLVGRYEEARVLITRCLELKEPGYAERGSMAAALGEKSQILASLGHFQEALRLDAQAREEIRRLADAGDTLAQEEQWIFQVDQGRIFWLLGRVDEAERFLREAETQIAERRKIYQVKARTMIDEIERWRATAGTTPYQLDWRWIERYRTLCAYDDYWWLAHAGPFTEDEQQQWDYLFPPQDEGTKDQLRTLLLHARDREVEAAIQERREPHLCYPAIEIVQVRERVAGLLALDAEIAREEPNAIVRRLYHGAIEDNLSYLRMIEAAFTGERDSYWEHIRRIYAPPTSEEMHYTLMQVAQVLQQGLQREDTQEASQQAFQILEAWKVVPPDFLLHPRQTQDVSLTSRPDITARRQQMVSPQAAQRFFETVLRDSGYEGWQVILDPNANGPRVESGQRHLYLQDRPVPLEDIREYLSHELLGHITRSVAGERSPLGLLGLGTQNYAPTEEGLATYHERRVAAIHDEPFDDSALWLGTLAIGLACGSVGHPQTFFSLFTFLEPFLLVYRLLWRSDEDRATAEARARRNARIYCLRTFRGVPNLECPGVCFTKDVVYLRGYLQIEQAVAQDKTVLDRLTVGKVALDQLPDLQEQGIIASSQLLSLRDRIYDPGLDDYILSFEAEKQNHLPQQV